MLLRDFLELSLSIETDECILIPAAAGSHGYCPVDLGKRNRQLAHRYVCVRVHGDPPSPKHHAAHSCDTKKCINKRHLRWATAKENEFDKVAAGKSARGERNGHAKLTREDVAAIRMATESQRKIAARYGVHQVTISKIKTGETWKHA